MRIITVNLPVSDIKAIKTLVGDQGLYPSRSELIRVAIRDFLCKELEVAKNFPKFRTEEEEEEEEILPEGNLVRIPFERTVGTEKILEYKTFKIITK